MSHSDFNGNGFDDLVIGVPGEGIGFGAVNVIFGSAGGPTAAGDQLWHQDSPGVLGVSEVGEKFGNALAASDFNNDGFDDLAIGVLFESVGVDANAGAVNVLFGSAGGLTAAADQLWHQDSAGVLGAAEQSDLFGDALAAGDFNNDGFDDLAIGVTGEDVDAGAVNVLFGSAGGLTAAGDQLRHQDSPGVLGVAEPSDRFGDALAAGDFNNDGVDDLAIGVSFEDVGSLSAAGAVNVFVGSAGGLTVAGNQLWHQDSAGVLGVAAQSDFFGEALAAGDFDNDGFDDLAIGVPFENVGGVVDAGAVNVLFGSAGGLTAAGDQLRHQDSPGVRGVAGQSDRFGEALAAGDFNNDGFDDLAVGVPREDVGDVLDAGAVNVLFGSAGGLAAGQLWHQDSPGILDSSEPGEVIGEFFGEALAAGDFNNDGFDDLLIGVPGEDVGVHEDPGAVNVLFGSAGGLTAAGDQFWHQDSPGVLSVAETDEQFGSALIGGEELF